MRRNISSKVLYSFTGLYAVKGFFVKNNDDFLKQDIKKTKEIWNELGSWWASTVQDGDVFHKQFVFPNIIKLAEIQKGELILDAGCGNGALARLMASHGARVIGVDFSTTLLEQARKQSNSAEIEYRDSDLTDVFALKALGDEFKFDVVVSSMVLHNMPTIQPFVESLHYFLKPKGSFIFSIPHPCFNSGLVNYELLKKNEDPDIFITTSYYSEVRGFYGKSKLDQPIEQLAFHRPLSEIFNILMNAGFVMNGFVEPVVNPENLTEGSLWKKYSHIPPVVIARWSR